jgi:hypothetical protein
MHAMLPACRAALLLSVLAGCTALSGLDDLTTGSDADDEAGPTGDAASDTTLDSPGDIATEAPVDASVDVGTEGGADSGVNLNAGLIAYWKFDIDGKDAVRTHHLTGTPSFIFDVGQVGQAFVSATIGAASGGAFFISQGDIDMNRDFTVACWAYRETSPYTDDVILDTGGIYIGRQTYQVPMVLIATAPSTAVVKLQDNSPIGLPPLHVWFHVIAYRSGTTIGIKINNQGTSTIDVTGMTLKANGTLYVGRQQSGYPWHGRIDEYGIWNRALSAAEMAQLYNGGAGMTLP